MTAPQSPLSGYDPVKYWTEEITDLLSPGQKVEDTPAHNEHCNAIMSLLKPVEQEIDTVLEIGCGYGRITKFMLKTFPHIRHYDAIDISTIKVNAAREYIPVLPAPDTDSPSKIQVWADNFVNPSAFTKNRLEMQRMKDGGGYSLVISTQCLMHQLPTDIDYWIKRMGILSKQYILTIDWFEDKEPPRVAPHNFIHNYEQIYMRQLPSPSTTIRTVKMPSIKQNAYLVHKHNDT